MKSKTHDSRWRPVPPYDPHEYRIVVTPDVGAWCDAFSGEHRVELETADGATLERGHQFVMVFQADRLTHGVIAHECFHVTERLLQGRLQIPVNDSTQEVYAYLLGWLVTDTEVWAKENSILVKNRA